MAAVGQTVAAQAVAPVFNRDHPAAEQGLGRARRAEGDAAVVAE